MMNFVDTVTIDGTRKRDDGSLIVDARAARTGIQVYTGYEVGKPEKATVRVFRPASEVFSRDTLASFAHRPVTNDHPAELVTADNWKSHAVGQTADEVTATDIYVRVPLMVSDAAAINDVAAGKRELSAGYTCDLDWTAGETSSGAAYDAVQRNIRVNHIAIVNSGRAGRECRIGDAAAWGISPIETMDKGNKTMTTRTVIVDGIPIEATDQSAAVIERLQRQLADSIANIEKLTADHSAADTVKDTTIGELRAEIAKLKDAAPKPADLAKMVADRAVLVSTASGIVKDFKDDGSLSDAEIRKAIVKAKMGDDAVKDASDAEISGMFKVLSKDAAPAASTDPFRLALATVDGKPPVHDHGQADYQKRLTDAWKGEGQATA